MTAWWRRKGQAARVELYIRVAFSAPVLLSPLLVGGLVGLPALDATGPAAAALAALIVVHTAVCLLLVRAGVGFYLGNRARPVGLMAAGAGLTVAGVGVATLLDAVPGPWQPDGPATAVLL